MNHSVLLQSLALQDAFILVKALHFTVFAYGLPLAGLDLPLLHGADRNLVFY